MGPSGASISHWNSGTTSDAPHCDWKHLAFAVGGAMALAGEGGGDVFVGDALTGEIEHPVVHLRPSRELGDGVNCQFDFEIACGAPAPDNPDQSDIVLAALKHDLVDQTAQ